MRIAPWFVLPLIACAARAPAQSSPSPTSNTQPEDQAAQSGAALEKAVSSGGQIVVTANRRGQSIDRVGQSVTVLDSATIQRRQAVIVSDLLREVPGVTVVRNGGLGTNTSVNIRGAETDQTVALIDGIKLNDPSSPGGGFNFANLLGGNVARIEVLRGAQSVLWGSQAIGGVINVITRQPTDTLQVNARAEGGSFGTAQTFANVSGKTGPLGLSLGAGVLRTDGISAFAGGSEPDGFWEAAANANASLALGNGASLDLRGFYSTGRVDIDAIGRDSAEFSRTRQALGYAGLNFSLLGGRLRNRIAAAATDVRRHNLDPALASPETFRGNGRNTRLEYQGVLDLASSLTSTFGAEREVSVFDSSSFGGPITRGKASTTSVYGQLVATPVRALTLTGGLRHDWHSRFGGVTTAAASGVLALWQGRTLLRASYSQGFKAPTLFQLQSEFGNTQLRPERSVGWDAGLEQRLFGDKLDGSLTWFERTSRDLIVFVSCPSPLTGICVGRPSGTYDNVSRARAQGLEASLTAHPFQHLDISANYTDLDARNRAPGANFDKRLQRRPSHSLSINADYRWPNRLQTGVSVLSVGHSFDNASNSRRLAPYTLVDLRAAMPITRQLELYGRVENLFDKHYQTIFQFGQLGRAAYAGVRLTY
jgi:vitamin B12 transporter